MRVRLCSLLILASALVSAGQAQNPPEKQPVVKFADGGADASGVGLMDSIFIPPKAGAPFDLKLGAEWSRAMANGGSFTLVNERRIVRDSRGRIYQERFTLVPKGGDLQPQMTVFQITDPDQHTWYNCAPYNKVCDLRSYRLSTTMHFQPQLETSGALPDGKGYRQDDDLGEGSQHGLGTHGYREVYSFNPGAMGNDKEMTITREFWFSPQLGINLSSLVDNPQTGKQIFTVKELSTSEPDPSMFEVPADYRVIDRRPAEASPAGPHP
ncbi:MAG TPA: hypothetical protein VG267_18195 [Terracidiphilus sp.]|jgi:hypothetical protein|nr:hypothetical protein [Terracidiphilus sp.]